MGTTLIKNRKNGYDPNKLSDQQRMFVLELLASDKFCVTKAARKAGYRHPAQAANKLLKNRHIRAALEKAQREREERCQLKADDVLNYLRSALFFNPLHCFRPSDDGKWLIENPEDLPEEVGRLIFQCGSDSTTIVAGKTEIPLWTWQHVVFTRDGVSVKVYLNGNVEIETRVPAEFPTVPISCSLVGEVTTMPTGKAGWAKLLFSTVNEVTTLWSQ